MQSSAFRTPRQGLRLPGRAGIGALEVLHLGKQEAHVLAMLPLTATTHHEAIGRALQRCFGQHGIHVNSVSPGPVGTDLWLGEHGVAATVAAATGVDQATARANVVASIGGFATGRFTTPEEVATLAVFLASQRTANVTGANFVIDGGLIKTT